MLRFSFRRIMCLQNVLKTSKVTQDYVKPTEPKELDYTAVSGIIRY